MLTLFICTASAVTKLAKVTIAVPCFRGVSGMGLPNEFWEPNEYGVCGGIEFGFTSCSEVRGEAMKYATARRLNEKTADTPVLLEVHWAQYAVDLVLVDLVLTDCRTGRGQWLHRRRQARPDPGRPQAPAAPRHVRRGPAARLRMEPRECSRGDRLGHDLGAPVQLEPVERGEGMAISICERPCARDRRARVRASSPARPSLSRGPATVFLR